MIDCPGCGHSTNVFEAYYHDNGLLERTAVFVEREGDQWKTWEQQESFDVDRVYCLRGTCPGFEPEQLPLEEDCTDDDEWRWRATDEAIMASRL